MSRASMSDHSDATIPRPDVARAKRYHRVRMATMIGGSLMSAAELAWFALSGRSARLRTRVRERTQSDELATATHAAVSVAGSWALSLPWSFLAGYLVERRFALTRQAPTGWLADRIKGLLLGLALASPLLVASYPVIRRRPDDWWLVLSGVAIPFSVLLGNLAPVLIMPLFNRFEPLDDEALERGIRTLAERAGVSIADVFRMDMSRQTEKANAFFTGIGKTKRIVLGDTMVDRYPSEEINAVVAHELGHQVHGDMWRIVAMGTATVAGIAYGVARLAPFVLDKTSERSGVHDIRDEAGLPVLGLVAGMLGAVAAPINAAFSRSIERRTDRFALELTGNGQAYAATMVRMAVQNLADPTPPRWQVFLLYSHPPVAERIVMAREFDAARTDNSPPKM